VTDESPVQQDAPPINLKDPVMAAFLAWLIPGLGHLYQGRIAKAVLFFVCIMGLYGYGVYLGGSSELGYGRAVYFAFRDDEWRLPYLCQIGVGLPSLPACVQAMRMSHGKVVFFNGFMAPPRSFKAPPDESDPNAQQPTLDTLNRVLNWDFELATTLTMIAGLLNVLAMCDAAGGPVVSLPAKKEEQPDKTEKMQKS
jgi:hypothetical protein